MWTTIGRLFGTTRFARFGSVLMLAGLAILAYSLGAYVGILPGGYTSVPEPVALSAAGPLRGEPKPSSEELLIYPDDNIKTQNSYIFSWIYEGIDRMGSCRPRCV